jgi:hypothetical protein
MGIPVEILHSDGCGRWEPARQALYLAAETTGVPVDVSDVLVTDQEMAVRLRFPGSPTIRIRGRDVEPAADDRPDFGLG